jgi:hypothetical protein
VKGEEKLLPICVHGHVAKSTPVLPPTALAHLPRRPVVVSVAGEAARQQIREVLQRLGLVEMQEFVCAA